MLPSLEQIRAELARRAEFEEPPVWFHRYQREAWDSTSPIVIICAGWQSGKTVPLPHLLKREIYRRGPGDYGAFSSTFRLLERKFLPELQKVFSPYAKFSQVGMRFEFTPDGSRRIHGDSWDGEPTVIQLGYAENPDSLESATLKGVVWDEPGQRLVPESTFRVVESRVMVKRGRIIMASRPYEPGWLEEMVKEPADHVQVINFPSWANPENPPADDPYWDRMRKQNPAWRFQMLYEGIFTRPEGAVFEDLDDENNAFTPVSAWQRGYPPLPCYVGLDWGIDDPFAAVLFMLDRDERTIYAIRECYERGLSTKEQAARVKRMVEGFNLRAIYYDPSMSNQTSRGATGVAGEAPIVAYKHAFGEPSLIPGLNRPRLAGIDALRAVVSGVGGYKLMIDKAKCPKLWEELSKAMWAKDLRGNSKEDIDESCSDHAITASYYFLRTFGTETHAKNASDPPPRINLDALRL